MEQIGEQTEVEVIIKLNFEVGTRFKDLLQFEERFKKDCQSKFVQFYKKDVKTIESARKKHISRYLKPELKFYSVRWCCIHGGRQFKGRGNGIRRVKTIRKKNLCPAFVQLIISDSGEEFLVSSLNFQHNHRVAEQLYKQLSYNRRLVGDIKVDTKKLLQRKARGKANERIIRADVEKKLNQSTLKALSNLQQVDREIQNNVEKVAEKIELKFGADCHLLIDEDNVLQGLFFCSEAMINSLTAYPEIVFLDATYKLLAIKALVYIILNLDGNGETNIVGVCILMSEDKESFKWFLKTFKELQPSATKILNIMTDKGPTERDVLRMCFPDASLHIYVLHVLNIFRREITCEKFNLASTTKDVILDLLRILVYSTSEQDFDEIVSQIEANSACVYDYLNENWINTKKEWCPFISKKVNNFMITRNNILDGINAKLKSVIDEHSSLEEFVDEVAILRDSLEKEKHPIVGNILKKRSVTRSDTVTGFEYDFLQLLTPYAFHKLKSQFSFNSVTFQLDESKQFYNISQKKKQLKTTNSSCTCYFSNSMGLPCKHIFAIRNHLKLNLFASNLVLDRWKMNYFIKHSSFLHKKELPMEKRIHALFIEVLPSNKTKQMTAQEKFQKTFGKAKLVATLASDVCGNNYHNINKALDVIINSLQYEKFDIFEKINALAEGGWQDVMANKEDSVSNNSDDIANDNISTRSKLVPDEENVIIPNVDENVGYEIQESNYNVSGAEYVKLGDEDYAVIHDVDENAQYENEILQSNCDASTSNILEPSEEDAIAVGWDIGRNEMRVKHKVNDDVSNLNNIKVLISKKRRRSADGSDITVMGIPRHKKKSRNLLLSSQLK